MECFDGKICITGAEAKEVIGNANFNYLLYAKKINNMAERGCAGKPALYPVDNFPPKYRAMLYEAYPELSDEENRLKMIEEKNAVLRNIMPDPNARRFFAEYEKLPGIYLTQQEQVKYENSAKILNVMWEVYHKSYSMHAKSGKANKFRKGDFWRNMSRIMPDISANYVNTLPHYWLNLQKTAEEYAGNNYKSLLNGRIGNQNRTKKQRNMIEKIVISIYGSKNKPFMNRVTAIYNEFVLGVREIYNEETGEIFNRADFYRNGEPDTISDTMVFNILNDPLNRKIVDRMRNDFHYNQNKHNASVSRKSPYFSLSKISMDDRDLVRKCVVADKKSNKTTAWVHAYYAFDVASGCIIGSAYSLKKDTNLIMECFRNMWNNLRAWGLNTPAEVEVENHLMKGTDIEAKLYKTFLNVTFTAPMNSREKRAEHGIKRKKYYGEYSEVAGGMAKGRHYAKHEAYLHSREKVFDEQNNTYKDTLEPWDFERVVAEDQAQILMMNNARHTQTDKKTKKLVYNGMKRFEVLVMKQHAELAPLNWRLLCKEWGKSTQTSLAQGRSFRVDYRDWWLSDVSLIERFKPNNTTSFAYYIPNHSGEINEIFVYQDDRFIDSPLGLGKFQEAKIERTAEDIEIMNRQLGFISSAKKLAKDAKAGKHLGKIGFTKTKTIQSAVAQANITEITDTLPPPEQLPELAKDYAGWSEEDMKTRAIQQF